MQAPKTDAHFRRRVVVAWQQSRHGQTVRHKHATYAHIHIQPRLATPPIDRLKLGVATSGNCAGPGSGLVWGCHPRDKCNWPKMQRLADSQLRTTTAIFQNEFSKSTAAVKGIHSRLCYTLQGNKKMSMQQILDRFIVPVYILIKYIIFNFK